MVELTLALLMFMVICWLGGCMLFLVGRHSLRSRLAIDPRRPVAMPLWWLGAPTPLAILHRRLRDAVALARIAVPRKRGRRRAAARSASPLPGLVDELELQAIAIDEELAQLAHLRGSTRISARKRLESEVAEVEKLARRLADAARRAGTLPGSGSAAGELARIAEHLDALEAARDELDLIEMRLSQDRI
jgi:hypothetical protein